MEPYAPFGSLLVRRDDPDRVAGGIYEATVGVILDLDVGTLEFFVGGCGGSGMSLGVAFTDVRGPVRPFVSGTVKWLKRATVFIC